MAARAPVRRTHLPSERAAMRAMADQVFSRTAGAPLVAAMPRGCSATRPRTTPLGPRRSRRAPTSFTSRCTSSIATHVGRRFVDARGAGAPGRRRAVAVRLVWLRLGPLFGLFRPLVRAGGHVRAFNPPVLSSALGWLRRDHRKLRRPRTVSGGVPLSGLCVGQMWQGSPEKKREPWRDTGTRDQGPAVAHAEQIICGELAARGRRLRAMIVARRRTAPRRRTVNLRLIPTEPFTGKLLRLDMLVTALARRIAVADRRLLHRHGVVHRGVASRRTRRRGRPAARAAIQRRRLDGAGCAIALPSAARGGRPHLRVERHDGARENGDRRLHAGRGSDRPTSTSTAGSATGSWTSRSKTKPLRRACTISTNTTSSRSTEIVMARGPVRRPPPPSDRGRRIGTTGPAHDDGLSHSVSAAVTGNRELESLEFAPLAWARC